MFHLTILGSNSAIPAYGRHPTAQILQAQDDCFLIDCGEGTQMQLSRYKMKTGKLSHIFISHLHGDHYFGLIGLLTSMSLFGRTQALHLHADPLLEKIITLQLEAGNVELSFPLHFHPIQKGVIADTGKMTVAAFEVQHRIPCWGFLFKEKKNPRKVIPDLARSYEIPPDYFIHLQQGKDYVNKKGTIIPNDSVTEPGSQAKSYAYCADTLYMPELIDIIRHVDLLYHETTYLNDMDEKARFRFHSTTTQAATLAKNAEVKQLIIGHFSSKYESVEVFLEEARSVFPDTMLATEGCCFKI